MRVIQKTAICVRAKSNIPLPCPAFNRREEKTLWRCTGCQRTCRPTLA